MGFWVVVSDVLVFNLHWMIEPTDGHMFREFEPPTRFRYGSPYATPRAALSIGCRQLPAIVEGGESPAT